MTETIDPGEIEKLLCLPTLKELGAHNNYLNNTVLDQNQPPNKRLSFPAKIDLILSTDKKEK